MMSVALATGCFSDPPSSTSSTSTSSTTQAGESESGPADSSTGSGSSSTTGPASSGTTFEPGTTGPGTSSSTGLDDTTGPGTTGRPTSCDDAEHILFLAFEGETLSSSGIGVDNAPERVVGDPLLVGTYSPYSGPDRVELLNAVRGHFAPFGLCVTDQNPTALDYDLIVVTSDTLGNGNAIAFEALDCGNTSNNNVNVVFLSDKVELGTGKRAIAISRFAAGLYGLESLGPPTPGDIMNMFVGTTNNGAMFTEPCTELANTLCVAESCPQGQQSSFDRLTAAFN